MVDLNDAFEKFCDDHGKFYLIESKLHSRPDLCAFLLLDKLVPCVGKGMVSAAMSDEIYLDVDCNMLADAATEDDIRTLRRCGVRYDEDNESLCMFV